jgi:hypothetical protein
MSARGLDRQPRASSTGLTLNQTVRGGGASQWLRALYSQYPEARLIEIQRND